MKRHKNTSFKCTMPTKASHSIVTYMGSFQLNANRGRRVHKKINNLHFVWGAWQHCDATGNIREYMPSGDAQFNYLQEGA